jgi:hypothetical protein
VPRCGLDNRAEVPFCMSFRRETRQYVRPDQSDNQRGTTVMGFFGTYQFDGTAWVEGDPEAGPSGPEPWMWVDVYDSDFVTVRYAPSGPGTGVAFLNLTPRIYFESAGASAPTDVARESQGLTEWWAARQPVADDEALANQREVIAALLASDVEPPDDDPEDEADIYAEMKAARFLAAMSLPLPEELSVEGE